MSESFGEIQYDQLPFPAQMKVGLRAVPVPPPGVVRRAPLGSGRQTQQPTAAAGRHRARAQVDWVRVYQRPGEINVGCSPPGFPTAQVRAAHASAGAGAAASCTACTACPQPYTAPAPVALQFLACNRDRYLIRDEEQPLIPDTCSSGMTGMTSGAAPAGTRRTAALLGGLLAAAAILLPL